MVRVDRLVVFLRGLVEMHVRVAPEGQNRSGLGRCLPVASRRHCLGMLGSHGMVAHRVRCGASGSQQILIRQSVALGSHNAVRSASSDVHPISLRS